MKRRRVLIQTIGIAMAFLPTANFGQSASPEILAGDYLSERGLHGVGANAFTVRGGG